jgi:glycosyltransferase involved in cell wall biosynthesis
MSASSAFSAPVPPERDPSLVSVIVAAYNAEAHLEQACRSALSQTHRALELIVVDDGSTDSTVAIVKRLAAADARVRLISQPNGGVAAARNAGIAAARGTFIAPLDADDLWDATKIARQLQRFDECGPRTGAVYAWWVWIDADGRTIDRSPRWQVEGRVLDRLMEVNFTGCASVPLFRRSTLDDVGGYDASLRARNSQGCEDWDLVLRVAERYDVAAVPAVLVGYRRHDGSMSTSTDTMWRSHVAVTDAVASRQPIPRDVMRRSRGQFALHLAGVAFWSGDYVRAVRWGLCARPFGLIAAVAPHVVRLLAQRVFRVGAAPGPVWPDDQGNADRALPEPLIPYDRIYAAHWARRHSLPR